MKEGAAENGSCILRELDFDDAAALLELLRSEAAAGRLADEPDGELTLEHAQSFILRCWLTDGQDFRAVTDETGRFGGLIGLRDIRGGRAEFCIALLPAFRGRGWARRAARLLLDEAFGPEWAYAPLQRIYMYTASDNAATRRFNTACGFLPVPPEPDAPALAADCCWYGVTAEQYRAAHGYT